MKLSEELEQDSNSGDFGLALEYAVLRSRRLESAFQALIDLAQECDSWESFPSQALEDAQSAIDK